MENLKIECLPIDSLKPYERNARKHTNDDVQTIVNSIREFGFLDPVGIWSEQNLIVEGHGRLLAAKQLGLSEVPCIRLDELTDEQRRAYAIAHNKTAEMSAWDWVLLDSELDGILDIDMSDFGFDVDIDSDQSHTDRTSKEIELNDTIIVAIDCENETDAETIFNKLQGEGYNCRILTL